MNISLEINNNHEELDKQSKVIVVQGILRRAPVHLWFC